MLGVLVMSVHVLIGQSYVHKPLKAAQCARANSVMLKFNSDNSGVFLVNYAEKEVSYYSDNTRPVLKKFARNKNNEWLQLDYVAGCGTGLGNTTLAACSYAYTETHFLSNFNPNYQPVDTIHTSLKYCVSTDTVDVCTEEVGVYLERYRFLPGQYMAYKAQEWMSLQRRGQGFVVDEERERQVQMVYRILGL